jgi:hypothetical protein
MDCLMYEVGTKLLSIRQINASLQSVKYSQNTIYLHDSLFSDMMIYLSLRYTGHAHLGYTQICYNMIFVYLWYPAL